MRHLAKSRFHRHRKQARVELLETRLLLAADLVAHWRANELRDTVDDGAAVAEWSDLANGISAVTSGSPTLVHDGVNGRAVVRLDADVQADVFRVPANQNPVGGMHDFSVAVAFATSSSNLRGDAGQWFETTGLVDASRLGITTDWGLGINAQGQISAGMGDGFGTTPTTVRSASGGLNDGQLHFVALVRQGGELRLYVDGDAPVIESGASVSPRSDSIDLTIGALQTRQGAFDGDIAEVRVYDGSLSNEEVTSLHADVTSYYNNSPPIAADDQFRGTEDEWLFPVGQSVLANDRDDDGDDLTAEVVETTQHGRLTLNSDGSFVYIPDDDFFGTDTFTYTANDFRPSNPATVTLEIAPTYDPVVTAPDQYKSLPTEVLQVSRDEGLLANDSNIDGANRQVLIVSDVTAGQLTLHPDGAFEYDAGGFAGVANFSYQVDDGTQLSAPETVQLIVNTPPTGSDDQYQVVEDTPFSATAAESLLANDRDADGDSMTVFVVDQPQHGTLALADDGTFSYEAQPDYFGADRFTYRIQDGTDESDLVTVDLQVIAVDDSPVANEDAFFGVAGEEIVVSTEFGVLANDSDVDSNELTTELTQLPESGTLDLDLDGSFRYRPNDGFLGTDHFRYRTHDGNSFSQEIEVSLFVGSSPLRISEFMAANESGLETRTRTSLDDSFSGTPSTPDWIEIQNLSSAPLDLSGFHLTDDRNRLKQWPIPAGTIIDGSGYLVVYATHLDIRDAQRDETGTLHTNFTLSLDGEYLAIASPDGTLLHEYAARYPAQFPDVAYGIAGDGAEGHLVEATPGAANAMVYPGIVADTKFSVDRGLYNEPFEVEISTATEGAEIRYTLDGSAPTGEHGMVYSGPIMIDGTTTLRAAAFVDGYLQSNVDTQTYLFLDQVIRQSAEPLTGPSHSPVAYPERWRGFRADYEMDPEITDSDLYANRMHDALTSLPSLSLTLDPEEIFGTRGLYSNPQSTNEESASAELIFPDGSVGFQIDAGARIQGGASRNTEHVKHSMSLRFREQYGAASLDFPVFPESPVTSFDSLHLRARYNNSWIHWDQGQRNRGSMIREAWMRDSMMAAGDISAGHGRYVHLYLNGLYWGVYEMHERQDASHYASYFGGDETAYDAYNANALVDGTRDAFSELRSTVTDGDWESIQRVLDVDNHIMYTIVMEYGGNQDLKSDGNWRIAGGGPDRHPWRFYVWDAERVLENVRQRGTTPVNDLLGFRRRLDDHPEYSIRFADHVHRLLFNGGPLTEAETAARWMERANQLESALVAESARWGDLKQRNPLTLDGEWRTEQTRLLEDYFPDRTANVISNFRRADLYPETDAPEFLVNDSPQHGGLIEESDLIQFENPNVDNVGRLLYTTDGSDPRLVGGDVSPSAIEYQGTALALDRTTNIKARILNGDEWSALTDATFRLEAFADETNLAVTEINYHPHDPLIQFGEPDLTDSEFEFIELANIGDRAIDLAGVELRQTPQNGDTEGVTFVFDAQVLVPGERLVVVRNLDAFNARYGEAVRIAAGDDGRGGREGQWGGGRLSNAGETISLFAADNTIIRQLRYDDEGDWPERADGVGSTLVVVDPAVVDADPRNWQASQRIGGTPGAADEFRPPSVVINEVLTNSDRPLVDQLELFNRSDQPVDIGRWYLSDSAGNLRKFQLSGPSLMPPQSYLVLDETQLGFGFKGQENDDVWFVSADESGRPVDFADSFAFLATASDVSLGRWPNGQGDLFPQVSRSFGNANPGPLMTGMVISEVNYNPAVPGGGSLNDRDLEFVEIWNGSATQSDIGGWRLGKAIDYVFSEGTSLLPNDGIVIVSFDPLVDEEKAQAFRTTYGLNAAVRLVGPFEDVLDNGGEKLELQRPVAGDASEFILVDRVRYDDDSPWPLEADGSGPSLHRLASNRYGDLHSSWISRSPTPGMASLGPPLGDLNGDGQVDVLDIDVLAAAVRDQNSQFDLNADQQLDSVDIRFFVENMLGTSIGDANLDGVFNSGDLLVVSQAGEFEDEVMGNSTWSEGDWNGDGDFGTDDIVWAFRLGGYNANSIELANRNAEASVAAAKHSLRGQDRRGDHDTVPSDTLNPTPQRHKVRLDFQARDLLFAGYDGLMSRDVPVDDWLDESDELL